MAAPRRSPAPIGRPRPSAGNQNVYTLSSDMLASHGAHSFKFEFLQHDFFLGLREQQISTVVPAKNFIEKST